MSSPRLLLALGLAAPGPAPPGHGHGPPGGSHGGHPHGPPGHGPPDLATTGPCDIYAAGGTPCAAAHSTTRALYGDYSGPLYYVLRGSDNETTAIMPMTAGGVADSRKQDEFCSGTTCIISLIFDQSGHGNNLRQAPSGGAAVGQDNGFDFAASAVGAPVTLNGQKAYGVFIQPGSGYRNDNTNTVAVGNEPEGMYAILDGTHYNGGCCFDYGNAETTNTDTGAGKMEAIYFGDNTYWNSGAGSGPWIMADMENGLYSEGANMNNPNDPTINYRFTHAIVKGKSSNHFAIRGGNAQSGSLGTFYSGSRPQGYYPMQKEGAIILGIGGDNSDASQGTFYEGALTQGYPSDDVENKVQANVAAAKYAVTSLTSGPPLTAGSSISVQAGYPSGSNQYLTHDGTTVSMEANSGKSSTFKVIDGNANGNCFSFESVDNPGSYLRHKSYKLHCDPDDGSMLFAGDSTFCPEAGLDGQGTSFRSWSYPTRYWRREDDGSVYIAMNGGPFAFDQWDNYDHETSWFVHS